MILHGSSSPSAPSAGGISARSLQKRVPGSGGRHLFREFMMRLMLRLQIFLHGRTTRRTLTRLMAKRKLGQRSTCRW